MSTVNEAVRLPCALTVASLALVVSACIGSAPDGASASAAVALPSPTIPAGSSADTTTAPIPATEVPTTVPSGAPPTEVPTQAVTPSPVAAPTVRATAAPPAPTGTSTFSTLAPGTALPSEEQCARDVGTAASEPRPGNRVANQSNAWAQGFRLRSSYLAATAPGYEERVTGNFTGTTDQIIRWAACKWGFDENDVRAQAVIESYWRQSQLGDCGAKTQPETRGCASVGLLQVKGADIPATHPGTWPAALTSTAFNVDYALAVRRLCYDGRELWLREFNASYAAGDLWGCIGRWYSGRWHDAGAEQYIQRVRATLSARTWAAPGF